AGGEVGHHRDRLPAQVEAVDQDRAELERLDGQPEAAARGALQPTGGFERRQEPVRRGLGVPGAADELGERHLRPAALETFEQPGGLEHRLHDLHRRTVPPCGTATVRSMSGWRRLGVAVAGFGWMGRVHSQAYARVLHHFPQLQVRPVLVAVADDALDRAEAAGRFGYPTVTRDWRDLATDPRGEAVSTTT